MQISQHSKTSDPLGCYYTKPAVGALLVNSMEIDCPDTVMDICVGDGALVKEAAKVWGAARFITVDIEEKGKNSLFQALDRNLIDHYIKDSLDLDLANHLGLQWGDVDIALCNPPYIRPKWKKHFLEILEDAGLSHVLPKMKNIPADILFIAQNLRLLRSGGRLGLILPDGIIAGEKYSSFRKNLLIDHQVERVIELPRRVFRNTDAKAHIVIVLKHGNGSELINIQRLESNGKLSPQVQISADTAIKRLDYSYVSKTQRVISFEQKKIGKVTSGIFRGSYSSIDKKTVDFPIFHTSDFLMDSAFVPRKYQLTSETLKIVKGRLALSGDILIARVGRNLEYKVCMVRTGKIAISDCIFLLRVFPEYRQAVFSFLKSEQGRLALEAGSHGVGAKFLTIQSLVEIAF